MHIEGTRSSPSIDVKDGIFEIKGRSIHEDPFEFYSPLQKELSRYIEHPKPKTEVRIHLEYINSGSKKYLTNF
ncbi:MAG: SiaC family regulatory phosphoprotein, partial [Bacteroidales bacterium]|nr:SiaC family regulatory phosphoprotein [Bacteroidales bacterium]